MDIKNWHKNWFKNNPIKEVEEMPPQYFSVLYDRQQAEISVLYDRQQAEIHADFYRESQSMGVEVVLCKFDKNYYIVPIQGEYDEQHK